MPNMPSLAAKLHIPSVRSELVPRPRLTGRPDEGLEQKLTLVSATAGFGKTTLLSDWATRCRWLEPKVRIAWFSVDAGDNDLARFSKGLGSWFWVVAIMGIAGRMSERGSRQNRGVPVSNGNPDPPPFETSSGPTWVDRLADYAKEAQLPFYVLHRTPMIIIGFYVVQWQVNALVKYVVIVLGGLVTILVVYDIAVRRTWPTRFLFGLRCSRENSAQHEEHRQVVSR